MLGEQAKKFQHWQSTMKVLLFKSAELILQSRCHPAPPSKCLAFSSPLRHSSAAHPVSVPPKLRAEKDLSKETALVGPPSPQLGLRVEEKMGVAEELRRLGVLAEWTHLGSAADWPLAFQSLPLSYHFTVYVSIQNNFGKTLMEKWSFTVTREA